MGLRAEVVEQPIADTRTESYMPYAMSVIVSRAIPELDGFKPSHRKLLYTMYQMKLLGGPRTKSANVVGQAMKLNPHGDAAIYDTMVRLSCGYGALLHPMVDSKGNFGKLFKSTPLMDSCGPEFDVLEKEIADLEETINSPRRIKKIIIKELTDVKTKYATPRHTDIIYDYESDSKDIDLDTPPE